MGKRSKEEYATSYVCMYTSHSIKQMAGRGSEKNKSCETRGIVE